MLTAPRKIELLSPAKNADIAIDAITHGADAVYIGAERFGARATAGNSVADIRRAVEFAHRFDAKIYATVNTILLDNELKDAERLIRNLYSIGIDALIVQDMGILRLDIPPIPLHASTQCDTRTPEKAKFLEAAGFSQIVLARELSFNEIEEIHQSVSVPLECFVHGALCVSYSGRCQASCSFRGRSANRGECAQLCRLPYDLIDEKGNRIIKQQHLLSLRDFNQSDRLLKLLQAGASSLKIEGRLKDSGYVKNVTAAYSRLLDQICEKYPATYRRASGGQTSINFTPSLSKSFNRGFTHYFSDNRRTEESMASLSSPKSIGEKIGVVRTVEKSGGIFIDTKLPLANGDGFVFFDKSGALSGFRANRADGQTIYPSENVSIRPGTTLYRNSDKIFTDRLSRNDSAERNLPVDFKLWRTPSGFATQITDNEGRHAIIHTVMPFTQANTDQTDARKRIFSKLGNTIFSFLTLDCGDTDGLFIPASVLTETRRRSVEALEKTIRIRHQDTYRLKENVTYPYPIVSLAKTDNVSNHLAETFYRQHGVTHIEPALEKSGATKTGDILMTTRYCIRRELNCCMKSPDSGKIPVNLTLVSADIRMSIEFDCKNCQMLLRKA